MTEKFEIEQLEERVAPSVAAAGSGIGGFDLGVTGHDSASVGLPLGLGNVSVGVNANDSVSFSGISL